MDKPQKADLQSMDVADDKRRQLAQLFPEAVTETRTEDGKLVHAVDYERLKGVLGEFSEILENQRERYGMTWPGKNECLKIIQQPSIATLKPCREESVNFDETENLFIEGDNLEALKLLQKAYYGKVKMIYIDPPYNTGKEFIYPDNYSETLETYLAYTGQTDSGGRKFSSTTDTDGRYHSKWLNMMYPRLFLAKNLLADDGVVFLSIDDHEVRNLRVLCDEVFGEENFVANVLWQKKYAVSNDDPGIAAMHDHILVYQKSTEFSRHLLPRTEKQLQRYQNLDNDPRGLWSSDNYVSNKSKTERPTLWYPIKHPRTGKDVWPAEDAVWRYSKERHELMVAENRLYWGPDQSYEKPRLKRFLSEIQDGVVPSTWWPFGEVGHNDEGQKETGKLLGKKVFSTPKPIRLIERMIAIGAREDDLVLDFFAGSCATAHAVLKRNAQTSSKLRFLMIQLPEVCDEKTEAYKAGHKSIADIGKERIRRAAEQLNEAQEGTLNLDGDAESDCGFRVFKLDRSNFRLWDGSQPGEDPEKIAKQLELHEQHIDPNATQEDILYELLLKAGFPLTTKVEKVEMAGKEVFSIAEGALLICLQDEITKELIKAMADADPLQVICLDSGFKNNDQLKANAVQTFKSRNKSAETATVFRTV